MTVTSDTGDNYTLKWTSTNNEGRAIIGSYHLKFTPFTKYTGESVNRKSDLAGLSERHQQKGFAFWLIGNILPIPAQYNHLSEWNYTTGYRFLPFPLNAGTSGTIPGTYQFYRETCSLYWGLISLFDYPEKQDYISPTSYHCEMANITIPTGSYNAYNVSIDSQYGLGHYSCWRYYVPELGNQVKIYIHSDWDTLGNPGTIAELELVDFNYTP
jgi:hypothetical protein